VRSQAEVFQIDKWQPFIFPAGAEEKHMFCAVSKICDILKAKPQKE
jgi:hypothetical protein